MFLFLAGGPVVAAYVRVYRSLLFVLPSGTVAPFAHLYSRGVATLSASMTFDAFPEECDEYLKRIIGGGRMDNFQGFRSW